MLPERRLRGGLEAHTGTNCIRLTTGAVYTVLGPTRTGGFFVYSWLGFWGLFSFRRAFALAVPEGSNRAYERLLFFSPSLLYWPSGIGKDAWMLLSLGLGANGAARALSEERRGLGLAAGGMALASLVRPHVAGAMSIAFAGAHLLRRPRPRLLPLTAFVGLLAGWAARYLLRFQIDMRAGWSTALDRVVARTSRGGSTFSPAAARTPVQASLAAGTVLFRPHVLETHNRRADVAAAGGRVAPSSLAQPAPLGCGRGPEQPSPAVRGVRARVHGDARGRVLEHRELRGPRPTACTGPALLLRPPLDSTSPGPPCAFPHSLVRQRRQRSCQRGSQPAAVPGTS